MKFFFILLIFLIGCSSSKPLVVHEIKEVNICENNTVVLNETVYINETCDTIYNESCKFEDDYVFELIRRVKFLENRHDDYTNLTIEYELEDCQDELFDCNETLEELRDLLD